MAMSKLQAALVGGLVAGTVDIGAASLINLANPLRICRVIAGGLFAREAITGGPEMIVIGILLQWAMSIVIAGIYVFAATRLDVLRRQWLLWGILYGIPVYFVMTYVVVPLSAWHSVAKFSLYGFTANMAAMMVFGAIVSYFASRTR